MSDVRRRIEDSPNYDGASFRNPIETHMMQPGTLMQTLRQQFVRNDERVPRHPLPLAWPGRGALDAPPETGLRATWLGHSTMLLEIGGIVLLVDPVWAERASPSQLVGPRRFHPPPAPLAEIPVPDVVLLTHDHFDHLDARTIRTLAKGPSRFVVPLGLAPLLRRLGVRGDRIEELDWWEELQLPGTECTLAAVPARHYSGRSLFRRNQSLWATWIIMTPEHRVFMGCDSGPYDGVARIAELYGPFDLAIVPIGQYGPTWPDIHVTPEQAFEEFRLLRAETMLPVHWGTFRLALHAWHEPIERLLASAGADEAMILTPRLGEPIEPSAPRTTETYWWRGEMEPRHPLPAQ